MLNDEVKNRCRLHMGNVMVQSSQTFVMGVPAGIQTQFVLEGSFDRLLPSAIPFLLRVLDNLDRILGRIMEVSENDEALEIGDIKLDPKAFQKLLRNYKFWQGTLANILGVPPNPYDQRESGGGINVPVR